MNKASKYSIGFWVLIMVFYLGISFVLLEFDVSLWPMSARALFFGCVILLSIPVVGIIENW